MRFLIGILILGLATQAFARCPVNPREGLKTLVDGTLVLTYRTTSSPVEVGEVFSVEVFACLGGSTTPVTLNLDANMPAHGHGMNYRVSGHVLGPGHSIFEGLLFHMPGEWALSFYIKDSDHSRKLTDVINVD